MPEIYKGQRLTHLLKNEVELWQRFLDRHLEDFDTFLYDIHLGEGADISPGLPDNISVAAKFLTQKRIDAVGLRPGEVWIFEIKPDAGLGALGQLVGYRALWIRERGPDPAPILAVVTDTINRDERFLFEGQGIRVYEVVPALP